MQTPPSPLATPLPWNLVASGYVTDVVPHFERYADEALERAGVGAGMRVVDVACGPGTLALRAAPRVLRVDALDFSPVMIEHLRRRAAAAGLTNVHATEGDGQSLPFPNEAFDAGFSMFGLIFFPDRRRGMVELHRVLRPRGRVALSSWQPLDRVPALAILFTALAEALPNLPFGDGTAPLGERGGFISELREAGFTDVEVSEVAYETVAPDPNAFIDSMERSLAPLVLLREKLGPSAYAPVAAALRTKVVHALGDGPVTMRMPAWLGTATRP